MFCGMIVTQNCRKGEARLAQRHEDEIRMIRMIDIGQNFYTF